MNKYRADLHVHTVLSPCADLEMSPKNIISKAKELELQIIGITDHNSTLQAETVAGLAARESILVLMGAEVTTREEIHCLTFFETTETLAKFQQFLDLHLLKKRNNPDYFGHQLVVDENEVILKEVEWLLIASLDCSIEEIEATVHGLGGIFIPAHIFRPYYSIISQLGFIPAGLKADAFDLGRRYSGSEIATHLQNHQGIPHLLNSDAHTLCDLGLATTTFKMESLTFQEFRMALLNKEGRTTLLA